MSRADRIGLGDADWTATRGWASPFAWGITGIADATLEWYEAIGPTARADDATTGWVALAWMDGVGHLAQETDRAIRWRGGEPGLQLLLDVDEIPAEWLDWLSQWVGVRLPPGLGVTEQRNRIRRPDSWARGRTDTIQAAVADVLEGDREVDIRERRRPNDDTDRPYDLTVDTYTAQTPDPDTALARAIEATPAGLRVGLTVRVISGLTWNRLAELGISWDELETTGISWDELAGTTPLELQEQL